MITLNERENRIKNIQKALIADNVEACILTTTPNTIYVMGQVVDGYIYIPAHGNSLAFIRRPVGLEDDFIRYIRKPEQIFDLLQSEGYSLPESLYLEGSAIPATEWMRLEKAFAPAQLRDCSQWMRKIRSIKTDFEQQQFRISAQKHSEVYKKIPSLFQLGMTDRDIEALIEYECRKIGHLGIFRTFGIRMEAYSGSVLAGDNACVPSPYDFALGGAGDDTLPIGSNCTKLEEGMSLMVDINGNFTGYISDMSRTFSIGKLDDHAYKAHQVALDIQNAIAIKGKSGTNCEELYNLSLEMADESGFAKYFMGLTQQAKFVGHGTGLEINEPPVIAKRGGVLQEGMVIALEPKFTLPGIGALGIENTFIVTKEGMEKITICEEEIINLVK